MAGLSAADGWTTASYSGSTPALTDLPAFPTEAAGPSTNLLSGTDDAVGRERHLLQLPDLRRLQRHRLERDGREDRHGHGRFDQLLLGQRQRPDFEGDARLSAGHRAGFGPQRDQWHGQRFRDQRHRLQLHAIRLPGRQRGVAGRVLAVVRRKLVRNHRHVNLVGLRQRQLRAERRPTVISAGR